MGYPVANTTRTLNQQQSSSNLDDPGISEIRNDVRDRDNEGREKEITRHLMSMQSDLEVIARSFPVASKEIRMARMALRQALQKISQTLTRNQAGPAPPTLA